MLRGNPTRTGFEYTFAVLSAEIVAVTVSTASRAWMCDAPPISAGHELRYDCVDSSVATASCQCTPTPGDPAVCACHCTCESMRLCHEIVFAPVAAPRRVVVIVHVVPLLCASVTRP